MTGLPAPREDGRCADCGSGPAVTNDRRFCLKCLRARIRSETPGVGWRSPGRSAEKRQAADHDDNNPWQQNALRSLEGE